MLLIQTLFNMEKLLPRNTASNIHQQMGSMTTSSSEIIQQLLFAYREDHALYIFPANTRTGVNIHIYVCLSTVHPSTMRHESLTLAAAGFLLSSMSLHRCTTRAHLWAKLDFIPISGHHLARSGQDTHSIEHNNSRKVPHGEIAWHRAARPAMSSSSPKSSKSKLMYNVESEGSHRGTEHASPAYLC